MVFMQLFHMIKAFGIRFQALIELNQKNFTSLIECNFQFDQPANRRYFAVWTNIMAVEMVVIWKEALNSTLNFCEVEIPWNTGKLRINLCLSCHN